MTVGAVTGKVVVISRNASKVRDADRKGSALGAIGETGGGDDVGTGRRRRGVCDGGSGQAGC